MGGRHDKPTYIRRRLKTGSGERAQEHVRLIEDSENPKATAERKDESVTNVQTVTEYLADAKGRDLSEATGAISLLGQ